MGFPIHWKAMRPAHLLKPRWYRILPQLAPACESYLLLRYGGEEMRSAVGAAGAEVSMLFKNVTRIMAKRPAWAEPAVAGQPGRIAAALAQQQAPPCAFLQLLFGFSSSF